MGATDVADELVQVAHEPGEARRVAALARGAAVATGVPGEHGDVGETEGLHDAGEASGVLVAPVEEDQAGPRRSIRRPGAPRAPIAIEDPGSVGQRAFVLDELAGHRVGAESTRSARGRGRDGVADRPR